VVRHWLYRRLRARATAAEGYRVRRHSTPTVFSVNLVSAYIVHALILLHRVPPVNGVRRPRCNSPLRYAFVVDGVPGCRYTSCLKALTNMVTLRALFVG
jgi:hypothetical protein